MASVICVVAHGIVCRPLSQYTSEMACSLPCNHSNAPPLGSGYTVADSLKHHAPDLPQETIAGEQNLQS